MIRQFLCAIALATILSPERRPRMTPTQIEGDAGVRACPSEVPGKSSRGVLVEYEPGGSSSGHTHPSSAFIYATVLEGAM